MSTQRWSRPVEELLESDPSPECDVLVIGSGYGGSIAASQLAGGGRRVWVLERGREYALGEFPEKLAELPGHIGFRRAREAHSRGVANGLFDLRLYDDVAVLVGNGLGGGSLINANVAVEPDAATLDDPRWPEELRVRRRRDLMTCFADVRERLLMARAFGSAAKFGKYEALARVAKALKARVAPAAIAVAETEQTTVAGLTQAACIRCGNCVTGCNAGAKGTLAMNVIPLAVQAGAEFWTGATALWVLPVDSKSPAGSARWRVGMRRTADGQSAEGAFEIRAHTVVLSAGTLGSSEILLRSHEVGLPVSDAALGKRFSGNGDMIAFGWAQSRAIDAVAGADPKQNALDREIGPTILGIVEGGDLPPHAILEDGAVPFGLGLGFAALAATFSLPHRYVQGNPFTEDIPKWPAWYSTHRADGLSTSPELARHAQVLLGMGRDEAAGTLTWHGKGEQAALDLAWEGAGDDPALKDLHAALRAAHSAGGFDDGDYITNPLWRALPDDFDVMPGANAASRTLSVHPLGGCAMGDDPATSVVDWRGEVRARNGATLPGLHVLDGSIIPLPLGRNPMLAIAGVAMLAARDIASANGWGAPAPPHAPPTPAPRIDTGAKDYRQPVTLQFDEWLLGQVTDTKGVARRDWDQRFGKGTLEQARRPSGVAAHVSVSLDVWAWLRAPSTPLAATLELWHHDAPDAQRVLREHLSAEPFAVVHGHVCLLAEDAPAADDTPMARAWRAVWAFYSRRGLEAGLEENPGESSQWKQVEALLRAALNHGCYRSLIYSFERYDDHGSYWVHGLKHLGYQMPGAANSRHRRRDDRLGKNMWSALVELELNYTSSTQGVAVRIELAVDLIDMLQRRRLQVREAPDTPTALLGVACFGALWLRALFQTSFWWLRGTSYNKLELEWPERPPVRDWEPSIPLPAPAKAELQRRKDGQRDKGAVLLIHGLAHGSGVFTTERAPANLAQHLHAQGFDVWVLDHRLSNRLRHYADTGTIDDIALDDIAAALFRVYSETGKQPVHVIAHCVGAAAFSMATLHGRLYAKDAHGKPLPDRPLVRNAVLHAVHPWLIASKWNRVSAALGAFYKDFLGGFIVNPIPPNTGDFPSAIGYGQGGRPLSAAAGEARPGIWDQLLDRIAASIPWSAEDLKLHCKDTEEQSKDGGFAVCNRMTLIYGREWTHDNLDAKTHRHLAGLMGPGHFDIFLHLYYLVLNQRLTTADGVNDYLTSDNLRRHWTFPTLLAHGRANGVFAPASALRSFREFHRRFEKEKPPRSVRLFRPEKYGHMDFLFGKHAKRDIYPVLAQYLADPSRVQRKVIDRPADLPEPDPLEAVHDDPVVRLLTGPLLLWLEPRGGKRRLSVWAEFEGEPPPDLELYVSGADGSTISTHKIRWIEETFAELGSGPSRFACVELTLDDLVDANHVHFWIPGRKRLWPWVPVAGAPWRHDDHRAGQAHWLAASCRWPGAPFEREMLDGFSRRMLQVAHAEQSDALLLLGDQIYADATADLFATWDHEQRHFERYRMAWSEPEAPATSELLRNLPVQCMIDDHEYRDNWPGANGDLDLKALETGFTTAIAFQWRSIEPGPRLADFKGRRGLWRSFQIGGMPAFAMDTRTERERRGVAPPLSAPQICTEAQWTGAGKVAARSPRDTEAAVLGQRLRLGAAAAQRACR